MKLLVPCIVIFAFLGFLNYPQKVDATANDVAHNTAQQKVQLPFSEQLRYARAKQQLSYEEIAQKVGISAIVVQNLESGKIAPVKEVRVKIAKALGEQYFQ